MDSGAVITDLASLRLNDSLRVGGKAANIGELLSLGLRVPPGFVILAEIDMEKTADQILHKFDELDTMTVAVRSSAVGEDGQNMSFAGQFDTYLHVTRSDLVSKIEDCRASAQNPRLKAYLGSQHRNDMKVSVIVQVMVEPDVSGVAFSKNPMTDNSEEIVIEAGYGLGEAIVSGRITPDQYIADKDGTIKSLEIAVQATQIIYDGKAISEVSVPRGLQTLQKLPADSIKALIETLHVIERHYKHPIDVEWALNSEGLYIMQVRPITT